MRERLKWGEAQVRRHLERLVNLEYAVCHRVPGTAAQFTYEVQAGSGPNAATPPAFGYDGKASV
jgi:predicted ArsR family transcriptional regulator